MESVGVKGCKVYSNYKIDLECIGYRFNSSRNLANLYSTGWTASAIDPSAQTTVGQ